MSREDVQSLQSFTSQSCIRPTETCTVQRERPTDPQDKVQKEREKCSSSETRPDITAFILEDFRETLEL